MSDMQKTIFGTSEPAGPHNDDIIVCSDDTDCRHGDVCYDVAGCAHSNEDDRKDANVGLVRDILDEAEKWSNECHPENGEWADGVAYIIDEMAHDWPRRVEEWLTNEFEEYEGDELVNPHADYMGELVAYVCEGIEGCFDAEYSGNEYAGYSGDGCCLYSLEVGECEEQIDINGYPELKAIHELRELDDVLDELDSDFCTSRSQRRVKNEETGRYEGVGRETYMRHSKDDEYPTFEIYTMPGGQWHYVVDAERMNELVSEFLAERAENDD